MTILDQVAKLAEPLRAPTFVKAAEFILSMPNPILCETGCYRGGTADGQSTLILAMLANHTGGIFFSHELNQEHITKARAWLESNGMSNRTAFLCGDSAETLKHLRDGIDFAYLDSYDFEEAKALDAQNHQLKEAQILLPKMAPVSAFLLDDCALPLGGKAGLSAPLILEHGYKEVMSQYQRLFIRA